jgi:hypothetical protein
VTLFFATRQATTTKKKKKELQQRKQGLNEANKYLLQQALEMANNLKMKTFKRFKKLWSLATSNNEFQAIN